MTIGTAMVVRTKVRTTGVSVANQSPRARLRTVRVGKTASQIITASWCLDGGPALGVFMLFSLIRSVRSGQEAVVEVTDGGRDVVLHEVGVERDGGCGAGAGGGDDLRAGVDDVAGGPDAGDAGAAGGGGGHPAG